MKTEISRNSFNPKKRYAGVYQQQGRMITDADLNELVDIIRYELEQLFSDVVGNGVPRGRALSIVQDVNDQNKIKIQPGMVYVDGVRGGVDAATLMPLDRQVDFPVSTAHYKESKPNDVLIYADIWQASVDQFDDPELIDVALGGADTTTRSKVITQIKLAPRTTDLATLPQSGNGLVTLKPQVQDGFPIQTSGNYLFRLEVHQVEFDEQFRITALTLKWSTNNGVSKFLIENVPSNKQFGPVYEMCNAETELYAGLQLIDQDQIQVGNLVDKMPEDFKDYTFVRAWDGYCTLRCSDGVWKLDTNQDISTNLSVEDIEIDNNNFKLRISTLELTLCLKESDKNKQFIVGDYWQIAVRERAQITGTEDAFAKNLLPQGIVHHYTPLATIDDNGKLTLLSKIFSQAVDPIFDGDITLGTDETSVVTVQGNIGIGTSHPQARLHIYSATQALLKIQGNSADEAGRLALRKQDNSGADLYYDAQQGNKRFVIDVTSNEGTNLANPPAFVISNDDVHQGNVGIGVADPLEKLDVGGNVTISGSVNITGNLSVKGTTTSTSTADSKVQDNLIIINNGQTGDSVSSREAGLEIDRGDGVHYKLLFREDEKAFTVTKQESDKNAAPQQVIATRESKPTQYGISVWDYVQKQSMTNTNFTYDNKTLRIKGDNAPLLKLQATTETSAAGCLSLRQSKDSGCDIYYDGTSGNESFKFELFQNNISNGKVLVISNKSGQPSNVGVGTENPNSRLHIVGSKGAASSIQVENNEIKFRSDAEQHISLYNSNKSKHFTIENTGKDASMGVVNSNVLFSVHHEGRVGIATVDPTIHLAIGQKDTGLSQPKEGELAIYANNKECARFNGIGNVGIGIQYPSCRLQIAGSKGEATCIQIDNSEIKFRSDTDTHVSLYNSRIPGNFTLEGGKSAAMGVSGDVLFSVHHAGRVGVATYNPTIHLAIGDNDTGFNREGENELAVYTNNKESMRFNAMNNVGVGIKTPKSRFHIAGSNGEGSSIQIDNSEIKFRSDAATETHVSLYNSHHLGNFTIESSKNVAMGTSDKVLFAVSHAGYVGISTYNPSIHLAIGDNDTGLKQQGDGELAIYTNNQERVRINSVGRVGIKTTTPTVELDVNGTVKANTISASTVTVSTINTSAMTINNSKPFVVKRYENLGDNVDKPTGYRTDTWVAAIIGFRALDGDIQEGGTHDIIQVYTCDKNGVWNIRADFATNNNNENWYVDVLFIRKELVDFDTKPY